MMKTKTLKIVVLMLLINIISVTAAIDASYKCQEKNCMEGTEIDFTVNIFNNINKSINVGDVYIKDKDYDTILGFDLSEKVVLSPNDVRSFNFTSLIKAPTKGYTFYYTPCFRMSYVDKPEEVFEICGKTVKSLTVMPLSKIGCKEDSECEEDEYCNTFSIYKCKKLECNPNESAVNHSCVVLEPEKIVVINWWNVILTMGAIALAVGLLFLFIKRKESESGDYIDMATGFGEDKETSEKEKTEKKEEEYKERKLDEDKKEIEESSKNLKEDKSKKDEKNKEIKDSVKKLKQQDESKKEVGGDEEIKKKNSKPKKAKNNKKKYKRVKQNKTHEAVSDYIKNEQKEETKKTDQEIENNNVEIVDYGGYEDDDEENRDIL